ncbi:MAG: hypothetical protein ACXAC5_15335 [Promethearchaeota archaeon]|jgi:predicted transporter
MALARGKDIARKENQQLYFHLICGTICAITALTGIIFNAVVYRITSIEGFLTGLSFWIFYLVFSLFLIGVGIYTAHKEKKYGIIIKKRKRKDIKPPIVP